MASIGGICIALELQAEALDCVLGTIVRLEYLTLVVQVCFLPMPFIHPIVFGAVSCNVKFSARPVELPAAPLHLSIGFAAR